MVKEERAITDSNIKGGRESTDAKLVPLETRLAKETRAAKTTSMVASFVSEAIWGPRKLTIKGWGTNWSSSFAEGLI